VRNAYCSHGLRSSFSRNLSFCIIQIMKLNYLMVLCVGFGLTCFAEAEKSESQKKIDSLISWSQVKSEKVDAATLTKDQLKDIWKKQISEMYFVASDGTLQQDKKYEWRVDKGWSMKTNDWAGLSMRTSFTVKRNVGDGIWLAAKDSGATLYVKPKMESDFSEGLKTNAFLNMMGGSKTIESESGVKLKITYHEVTEISYRRPAFEDFNFLLENGKSFSVVLPKKVTCPACLGTGSVKTTKKMGTRSMAVTEFCKTCNNRKTVDLPLLSTLAK